MEPSKQSLFKKFIRIFFADDIDIQTRMLNLMLWAVLIGGLLITVLLLIIDGIGAAAVILGLLAFVSLGIFFSVKKRPQLSGTIVTCSANLIFFPIIFCKLGGLHSGVILWFVLGLIFAFITLRGALSFVVYGLGITALCVCIFLLDGHPEFVSVMPEGFWMENVILSLAIVSAIFGAIFKYQNYVYEKQSRLLMDQEKKLRETMEDLKVASRAKSEFLANMSHEIRTPINGILGMNAMLLKDCKDDSQKEYAMNIHSAGHTLLSIINSILDISKIESGKMELQPADYELFSVLNDCYNLVASRAEDKELNFKLDVNPNLPSGLWGDEVRVRQIINNLLSNAVKYTEKGFIKLSVDYELAGGETVCENGSRVYLKVVVSDSGMGIRREDLSKLFQMFQRIDENRNRTVEGTGLGLNLTKKLVEMMDGFIEASSEYGKGSVFSVTIPQIVKNTDPMGDFAEKYRASIARTETQKKVFMAPGRHILVVDDVKMNLKVVEGLLKETKIKVDTVNSGKLALDLIQRNRYDMIYLDHMMPEMDGIETMRLMRLLPNNLNRNTPIIMLTANAVIGAKEFYLKEGFSDYLSKPVREADLIASLKKYLPQEAVVVTESPAEPVAESVVAPVAAEKMEEKIQKVEANVAAGGSTAFEKLNALPDIDAKAGLELCMNDEEFYLEMVEEFCNGNKMADLERLFAANDLANYRITVHALKSTSLTIGLAELSASAKALEMASASNDVEFVKKNHAPLMEKYGRILQLLKEAIS
ncbi:hybrid sensor histidine kinase/response regulator [Fibrobacter sp. UWEL]|uniref:hybrid sensor histidine kinase/response regulator n=1 Tax=Fibrobacter sp. UWEL TaxID=1896209 RepID=UPI000918DE59|nr:hybrid sensor histidine kinase/response regulator [Fibrobacter sp. UWEL]SHK85868.1 Signal transduction histidine kinase [Fibrobacter sp. UWEL]